MNPIRRTGLALAGATALISGVAVYLNGNGVAAYGDATAYTTAKNLMAALVIGLVVAGARRGASGRSAASSARVPASSARTSASSSPVPASSRRPHGARAWLGLAYVAVLGGAVPFVLFFEGLASTASTQAAFLHKMLVVIVAVLAVTVLKERLTWWHGAAIVLLVVAQVGLAGDIALVGDPGTMLVAAATVLWAVEVIVAKRLLAGLVPGTLSVARMGGGSVALLLWCALTGRLGAVVPATAAQLSWVIVTGVLLAGYVLTWHHALARAQAVDVTAVLVLGALVTAALAGALDGAALGAQAPWLVLMLTGGLLIWKAPAPTRSPHPRRVLP